VWDLLSAWFGVLVVADEGIQRYRLLESIREYGLERLEATGDARRVRRAHAEYSPPSPRRQFCVRRAAKVSWTIRLDHELDNLRAVLEWASTTATPTTRSESCASSAPPPAFTSGSIHVDPLADAVLSIPGVHEHPNTRRLLRSGLARI
jgi:predicted ATPase